MISTEELQAMTVAELRKFAKENSVIIGTITLKKDIINRILDGLKENEKSAAQEAPQQKAPVRRAVIIADSSDDMPAPPPARQRPEMPPARTGTSVQRPAPSQQPKGNKPTFTLQGARAWHNPQPFTPMQPQGSRYAPQTGQPITTYPLGQAGGSDGQNMPAQPRQPAAHVSRFGPVAAPAAQEDQSRADKPQVYRAAPASQPLRRYPAPARTNYRQPLRQPVYQPGGAEQAQPAPYQGSPLRRAPGDFGQSYQQETRGAAPVQQRVREPFPARDMEGVNPAVPEMLATGDCGDGAGVLEIHADGYGFLRAGNFLPGKNDVYVSNAQIRRFHLRNGDYIEGKTRPQRETDRYAAMLYITRINGVEAEEVRDHKDFDELTPVYPDKRINLSSVDENDMVLRLIDLFSPVGFGQRAMIVAAPKAGKTTILKKIALAIRKQHEDIHLMMLLVDERPEEVTDLKETVGGDVFHSTFDEPAESHVRVSELVLERAMRLVEQGKDVVVLMDSLTRLSRAYNTLAPSGVRVMSGGLAAGVLNKPKKFFGAARNLREGGSLTVIATALVETGSRMDEVIFEEFKGTGNMELVLDRQLSEMRVFPAISIARSGTRHEELLLTTQEADVAAKVRAMISGASEQEGISLVLSMMEKTKDNADFVARYDDWIALMRGGMK
ncbi:MAG: transcription termination factor Rho [Christensenellales bacterium]|jgi:transcription termination factor Rho